MAEKSATKTYRAVIHVLRDGTLHQFEETFTLMPGQGQHLDFDYVIDGEKHEVSLIVTKGRWQMFPGKGSRVGIAIPCLGQHFWADLERTGKTLVSGRFRHYTGKDQKGRELGGRFVGGFSFQLRPAV